jgi:hypothetical protein
MSDLAPHVTLWSPSQTAAELKTCSSRVVEDEIVERLMMKRNFPSSHFSDISGVILKQQLGILGGIGAVFILSENSSRMVF